MDRADAHELVAALAELLFFQRQLAIVEDAMKPGSRREEIFLTTATTMLANMKPDTLAARILDVVVHAYDKPEKLNHLRLVSPIQR